MPSIRKRENKSGKTVYEIRVSTGRDQSRLCKRWTPPDGWSKRSIDRELASIAAEFERQCKSGEHISRQEAKERAATERTIADSILTLKEYGETIFMPTKAITMSENGRSNYQGNLDRWIYPALGTIKMPDVTTVQIGALLLNMQSNGKAHGTVLKIYTILRSLFKKAYMEDVIPKNPMDKVERPKPRKNEVKKDIDACSVEEARYILRCLECEPLKWQALFRLIIDTGVRRGECCGLHWSDIDFKTNTIIIRRNLCYTPEKGVYEDIPKNSKFRQLDIDPEVMRLLKSWRIKQASQAISQYVFSKDNSPDPMHPQSPTRYLSNFAKKYSIASLGPHKLRHTFASIAITHGADVASVSEKLGHSDKAVTLRMYTHADQESIKRAGNIFRSALKENTQEMNKNTG